MELRIFAPTNYDIMDFNDFISTTPLWMLILFAVVYVLLCGYSLWLLVGMFREKEGGSRKNAQDNRRGNERGTKFAPIMLLTLLAMLFVCIACEKPLLDEATGKEMPGEANVILHFTQYEASPLARPKDACKVRTPLQRARGTRAATDITELCSRLNIAVFNSEGTKVKTVAQKEGDANYGTVALSLAAGTYQLVVIAHNGDGSATISTTEKVTFPNNKVTDTFYYYGDLVVSNETQNYDLTLTRAVAMFRLVLTDEDAPSTVAKFKFYYTGGSSTFSPKDGYGCVNSKQTEIRTMAEDGIYEIYTLPHTEEDVLTKLTITALDANDNTIKERIFENVPVTRNQVTRYTGSFFGSGGGGETGSGDFRMTADPDWDAVNGYTF